MTKLANPWKCDNPTCGILRENDTNHWLLLRLVPTAISGVIRMTVRIEAWSDKHAGRKGVLHACGIDCGLRVAAALIETHCFTPSPSAAPVPSPAPSGAGQAGTGPVSSTGKEGGND